jgi:cysteine desulfurase/selenocysteine lyase
MTRYPDMASPDMDGEKVRAQFPILSRKVHDSRPLIYLDNAATTHKPQCVIDAVSDYYLHFNANVHRSVHWLGAEATRRFEDSRQRIAAFIGSKSEQSVVFTRGTTESINLVAHAWGRKNIGAGDEILLTEMEHHSNLIPWQLLAEEKGARLKVVPVMRDGELDQAEYERLLSKRVKLAAFTHVSNVLGTVNPVREMVAKAGAVGALTLIDAAQSAPHIWIDVEDLDCDFLAFSGHKMYGPTGVGVLYGREEVLWEMDPFMSGGEMIASVQLGHSTWADPPQRFEAGTPDIAGAIGLAAAVEFNANLGLERISG